MIVCEILYFLICSACVFALGNIVMLPVSKLLLLILIPFFIVILFLPVLPPVSKKIRSARLRIANRGSMLLKIFLSSMIVVLAFNIPAMTGAFASEGIPAIGDAGWRWTGHILLVVLIEAAVFWSGILRIYLTANQLGMKYRLIGILCGWIPIVNIICLGILLRITDKEIKVENDKIILNESRASQKICETKYPILMVHGVFFRDFRFFNYWGRIPGELETNGAKVFYGNQQSAASVESSGRELAERIRKVCEETGSEKVNIIAHSKGGLDCRMAIAKYGAGPYVASLTTINTPHRGCEFADFLLTKSPEKLKKAVAGAYNSALLRVGDYAPDFIAACQNLTKSFCAEFNERVKDPEGVYIQSFGSYIKHNSGGQFPLNLTHGFVGIFDGANDGLVGEKSFPWGADFHLIAPTGKRGISHGDVIDLNRENIPGYDVREFYVQLVADLKKKGF